VKKDEPQLAGQAPRLDLKFRIAGAPVVANDRGSFVPETVLVSEWPSKGKARVQVTGVMLGGYRYHVSHMRSKSFGLRGYEQYEACPDWLWELVVEAGWPGEREPRP
jgi:hypothetical protein